MKMDRKKPVERMLRRIFKHCKTFEEIQEIWNIQLVLLDGYERKSFYIFVFNEYQFLFKSEKS